ASSTGWNRGIIIGAGGGTIDANQGSPITFSGSGATFTGSGALTFINGPADTTTLAQPSPRSGTSSSWTGNVAISLNGGTLSIGNGGGSGFLPGYTPTAFLGMPPSVPTITVNSGATLKLNHGSGGANTNAVVIT